jgi:hypothetical protein
VRCYWETREFCGTCPKCGRGKQQLTHNKICYKCSKNK